MREVLDGNDSQGNEVGRETRPPFQGRQPSLSRCHGLFLFKGVRGSAIPHSFRRSRQATGLKPKISIPWRSSESTTLGCGA
jgi:hypothetical protein